MRSMVQQAPTHVIQAPSDYRLTSCSHIMPACIAVPYLKLLQLMP